MCSRNAEPGNALAQGLEMPVRDERTRIKLCGLRQDCDIAWANELMPDYVGFVFAQGSRRYVESRQAAKLSRQLRPEIVPVGVFVDAPLQEIVSLLEQKVIRMVQLHGHEKNDYVCSLREETDCPILQAFRIREERDIARANASGADLILLDSGGGSGETFDWALPDKAKRPYILAGGLTPENVAEAIRDCHPFGVDASSSLETEGRKDREKMAAFVKAVREADNGKSEK